MCQNDNQLLAKQAELLPSPSYRQINYPNGDVIQGYGVCSRSYRKIGIDLQHTLHEDMKNNFSQYPSQSIWSLKRPDTNIDHYRVQNLEVFFSRKGITKPITSNAEDYLPGDIVSWRLDNGRPHIGIVTTHRTVDNKRYLIMHNIGYGQVSEDILFRWGIVGHYSYLK